MEKPRSERLPDGRLFGRPVYRFQRADAYSVRETLEFRPVRGRVAYGAFIRKLGQETWGEKRDGWQEASAVDIAGVTGASFYTTETGGLGPNALALWLAGGNAAVLTPEPPVQPSLPRRRPARVAQADLFGVSA